MRIRSLISVIGVIPEIQLRCARLRRQSIRLVSSPILCSSRLSACPSWSTRQEFPTGTWFPWDQRRTQPPPKLKENKFANYVRPIARLTGSQNRRTTGLLPFDDESIMRSILYPSPLNRHSSAPVGECAILW